MQRTPPTVILRPARDSVDRGAFAPRAIVLHHTGGTDSLSWLAGNPQGTSAHVLIHKGGIVYRMVPDERGANAVGFSNLGRFLAKTPRNPNLITLNIEIENLGDGKDPYTDDQYWSVGWQVAQWWNRYNPLPVLTHALIDTNGKTDPYTLDLARVLRCALAWYDG